MVDRSLYPKFRLECNSPALIDQYMSDNKDRMRPECWSVQQDLIYNYNGDISIRAPLSRYPQPNQSFDPNAVRLMQADPQAVIFGDGGAVVLNKNNRAILKSSYNNPRKFEWDNMYGLQ
jgi:hypothetical protein